MSRSTQLVVANIAHFLSVNLYYFSLSRDRRLELERDLGPYNPATLHSDIHSQGDNKIQTVLYVETSSLERREEKREEIPIKCETDF